MRFDTNSGYLCGEAIAFAEALPPDAAALHLAQCLESEFFGCRIEILALGDYLFDGSFLLSPYLGLLSAGLVATILGRAMILPSASFVGDAIVVLYLLILDALEIKIHLQGNQVFLVMVLVFLKFLCIIRR